MALLVLHDAFDRIVCQTIISGEHLKCLLASLLVDNALVETIAVGSQPQSAVLSFAETAYFVNDG